MWIGIIIAVVCLGGFLFWMQSKKKEKEAAEAGPAADEDTGSPQTSDSFDETNAEDETVGDSGLAEEETKDEGGLKLENEAPSMEEPKEEAGGEPTAPEGETTETEENNSEV